MPPPNVCAAPSCNRTIPFEHLMCQPHWKMLPYHLQKKCTEAWRFVHRDRQGYQDALAEAVLFIQSADAPAAQERLL